MQELDGTQVRVQRESLGWSREQLRTYSGVVDIEAIESGRPMDESEQSLLSEALIVGMESREEVPHE